MKKKRITYGVAGMMEYQSIIRFGKNTLKVTFSGGSMNAIGVTPATFTTENFLIQQAIENSGEYRRGRIRTVSTVELDEEVRIERARAAGAVVAEKSVAAPAEAAKAEAETPDTPDTAEAADAGKTQVEFSCNDDAKDYLEQTFGYVRSKLRNREDIVNAGKAHGVEIIFV